MKLHEKIFQLRRQAGLSQEEMAEKLNISRQALSRWENGSAMPDAGNLLELSRLFHVSADYLLNDDYQSDNDLPKVRETKARSLRLLMILLITLQGMGAIFLLVAPYRLHSELCQLAGLLLFGAVIGIFEYAYQKNGKEQGPENGKLRRRFYTVTVWLGAFFPIRYGIEKLLSFYPRPVNYFVVEGTIVFLYLLTAGLITWRLNRKEKA